MNGFRPLGPFALMGAIIVVVAAAWDYLWAKWYIETHKDGHQIIYIIANGYFAIVAICAMVKILLLPNDKPDIAELRRLECMVTIQEAILRNEKKVNEITEILNEMKFILDELVENTNTSSI